MPKRRVSHHLGSATVIVRNKQTQGLETHRLEPCPSLLLLWGLQTISRASNSWWGLKMGDGGSKQEVVGANGDWWCKTGWW